MHRATLFLLLMLPAIIFAGSLPAGGGNITDASANSTRGSDLWGAIVGDLNGTPITNYSLPVSSQDVLDPTVYPNSPNGSYSLLQNGTIIVTRLSSKPSIAYISTPVAADFQPGGMFSNFTAFAGLNYSSTPENPFDTFLPFPLAVCQLGNASFACPYITTMPGKMMGILKFDNGTDVEPIFVELISNDPGFNGSNFDFQFMVPENETYLFYTYQNPIPAIILISPANGMSTTSTTIPFTFTATDKLYPTLNCSLYVDSILSETDPSVVNGTQTTITVSGISIGTHSWDVMCVDAGLNTATSDTWGFKVTTPSSPPHGGGGGGGGGGGTGGGGGGGSGSSGSNITLPHQPPGNLSCGSDADCLGSQACFGGTCRDISGICGYAANHTWNYYQCCSDDMCPADQRCKIPPGQSGGVCTPYSGCGEYVNHTLIPYECGDSPLCPACPENGICFDHECISGNLASPPGNFVGENLTVNATINGMACRNCEITIIRPDGQKSVAITDSKGQIVLALPLEGLYTLILSKNGAILASKTVRGIPNTAIPPLYCFVPLLILLLLLLYLLLRKPYLVYEDSGALGPSDVALPKPLMRELKLEEGDPVALKLGKRTSIARVAKVPESLMDKDSPARAKGRFIVVGNDVVTELELALDKKRDTKGKGFEMYAKVHGLSIHKAAKKADTMERRLGMASFAVLLLIAAAPPVHAQYSFVHPLFSTSIAAAQQNQTTYYFRTYNNYSTPTTAMRIYLSSSLGWFDPKNFTYALAPDGIMNDSPYWDLPPISPNESMELSFVSQGITGLPSAITMNAEPLDRWPAECSHLVPYGPTTVAASVSDYLASTNNSQNISVYYEENASGSVLSLVHLDALGTFGVFEDNGSGARAVDDGQMVSEVVSDYISMASPKYPFQENVSDPYDALLESNRLKTASESECLRITGLDRFPCYDRQSCLYACSSVPLCSGVEESGWAFIDTLLDYWRDINKTGIELDSATESSRQFADNASYQSASLALDDLVSLDKAETSLIFHPLITQYGLCQVPDYGLPGQLGARRTVLDYLQYSCLSGQRGRLVNESMHSAAILERSAPASNSSVQVPATFDCSSCIGDSVCEGSACVEYGLAGSGPITIGSNTTIHATRDKASCIYCGIRLISPGGTVSSDETDRDGDYLLSPDQEGIYTLMLLKGGPSSILSVDAIEPLASNANQLLPLLLLILVLLILILFWLPRKKAEAKGPKVNKSPLSSKKGKDASRETG